MEYQYVKWDGHQNLILTAQMPAAEATIPLEINIGFNPFVLRKTAPLIAPAATLFKESSVFRSALGLRIMPSSYLRLPL